VRVSRRGIAYQSTLVSWVMSVYVSSGIFLEQVSCPGSMNTTDMDIYTLFHSLHLPRCISPYPSSLSDVIA
jgi:hypothetical protein